MPEQITPYTDLQDLTPLPIAALQDEKYEQLYNHVETFNPIQTQLFHVLYHTDTPVLLGAPTGSGKTFVAEIALLRMKRIHKDGICVYIAPLKSLARQRLTEWRNRFGSPPLNWNILELSGDTHHDQRALEKADVLVCTPEKWDLISRGWRGDNETSSEKKENEKRAFIKRVRLLVIDEIHLLGEERGAVLEAIVSRTRFISQHLEESGGVQRLDEDSSSQGKRPEIVRIVGLSTAVANPLDLADWIGIDTKGITRSAKRGLYNFRPSIRPVPTFIHVQGYPGKHYCPRMATMNKPCYAAIKQHAPDKPSLIFVASRRQTRLTAFDIISYAAREENPKPFLNCEESYIEAIAESIHDEALRHTIGFGIGLHHAGLSWHDREIVERLYLNGDIQVLVATATLAWGVNLPARLVIVKGTEYFDGKTSRYVDYPLTDVLQMIGRAGRPGFDTEGRAVVLVETSKKNFYMKFLYTPFPVESCLNERLCENLNAEIAIGTVNSVIDSVGYLTWTFFARRVKMNPSYYGAKSASDEDIELFLLSVIKDTLKSLKKHGCVEVDDIDEVGSAVRKTSLGAACSKFYLGHQTPKQMQFGVRQARKIILKELQAEEGSLKQGPSDKAELLPLLRSTRVDEVSAAWLLYSLVCTHEFDELPVRHNEEILNEELSKDLMWGPDTAPLLSNNDGYHHVNPEVFADPHTKGFLLLQAHLQHAKLPISDYVNDTKSLTEQVPRLLAAMQYIAEEDALTAGTFELVCQFYRTRQLLETRSSVDMDPLLQLPGIKEDVVGRLIKGSKQRKDGVDSIQALRALSRDKAASLLKRVSGGKVGGPMHLILDTLYSAPLLSLKEVKVWHANEKTSGRSRGTLKVSLDIQRENKNSKNRKNKDSAGISLSLVLGSWNQRMLLAQTSIQISREGSWSVTKEMEFDWSTANADGGENGGKMVLRLLFDGVRGFDSEVVVRMV